MLNKIAGWNTDARGLTGCIRSNGFAKENAKDATERSVPLAINCASDGRVPSTDIVDIVYAAIIDSSIMISICCTADSNVQRPCRMMSTHELIEGVRVVKGAAVEASPSWTIGVSSKASMPSAHLSDSAEKALPCFFCCTSCSFFISAVMRANTAFIALIWPITPVSSPRSLRFCISSSTHSCCLAMRPCRLRAISSLPFFAIACPRCCVCFLNSSSASSATAEVCDFSFSGASSETLALPKPLRSAKPTSASFSAPTSFPPSPHIRA
mmetsp:Transcript_71429/g.115244  ORF Transcript_71429/g.115244 Transcript_71429/m.115244 type:complete len:268 (-) Transcript_71429:2715-3518(-)